MNDIKFIEALKQKRNACDYSQSRLAQELQISRQNLNEIENGKTKTSKEMKHILLHYLDYCNCTQPFTLTIDYLRVRFPTTDALEIIKNVLAMKSEYFIHEDYGMFGYEEQYIYVIIDWFHVCLYKVWLAFSSLCRKVRYNYISETNWKLSNWNVKGGTCEWKKLE